VIRGELLEFEDRFRDYRKTRIIESEVMGGRWDLLYFALHCTLQQKVANVRLNPVHSS